MLLFFFQISHLGKQQKIYTYKVFFKLSNAFLSVGCSHYSKNVQQCYTHNSYFSLKSKKQLTFIYKLCVYFLFSFEVSLFRCLVEVWFGASEVFQLDRTEAFLQQKGCFNFSYSSQKKSSFHSKIKHPSSLTLI